MVRVIVGKLGGERSYAEAGCDFCGIGCVGSRQYAEVLSELVQDTAEVRAKSLGYVPMMRRETSLITALLFVEGLSATTYVHRLACPDCAKNPDTLYTHHSKLPGTSVVVRREPKKE